MGSTGEKTKSPTSRKEREKWGARRRSAGGDESPEARLRPPSAFASAPSAGLETDAALAGADGAGPHLAASVLRFRCLLGTQARGEAAIHAPQSSEAGTRSVAATVDMEQLPPLRV